MAIQVRNSVLAVKTESVENTPVAPSASVDFVPLQDNFTMDAAFSQLENKELKASIGVSKSIVGVENPTASFTHYLKHSGTEGVAPQFNEIIKSAFGAEVVASTQYTTASSSTDSVVKVGSGNGSNFQRGQGLLVKDPVNGFSIRPVESVVSDDLTLGFNLSSAPASGVGLGKACLYKPTNSAHPSLSLWHYAGNSGAVQLMSGAKTTSVGMKFNAGELIGMDFSFEGLSYFFNPITTTASAFKLKFTDDTVTNFELSLPLKTWKDPHDLASAIQTLMNASGTTQTHTVVYSDSLGKFIFTNSTGVLLTLKFSSANSVASLIGFAASDLTGATTYTSSSALTLSAPYQAAYDSSDPLVAKSNEILIGDSTDTASVKANSVQITLTNSRSVIGDVSAESGRGSSLFNKREIKVTVQALLDQFDASKFAKFRANQQTKLMYSFGSKTGGNWDAGKCGCLFIPTATITSHSLVDTDGVFYLNMELKAYADTSGNGEFYLTFL